jgi:hypothetical protein
MWSKAARRFKQCSQAKTCDKRSTAAAAANTTAAATTAAAAAAANGAAEKTTTNKGCPWRVSTVW